MAPRKRKKASKASSLKDKAICFFGRLSLMNKTTAQTRATEAGAIVKSSLSSKVDIVVVAGKEGSSRSSENTKKIQERVGNFDCEIWQEHDFAAALGEDVTPTHQQSPKKKAKTKKLVSSSSSSAAPSSSTTSKTGMIDFEVFVQQFLELGRSMRTQHETTRNLTARQVLDQIGQLYQNVRVKRATLTDDRDRLLLQWGTTSVFQTSKASFAKIVDARNKRDIAYDPDEYNYLNFTRQFIFRRGEGASNIFQLSTTVTFGPARKQERRSNKSLWISRPDEMQSCLSKAGKVKFIKERMDAPIVKLIVSVDKV